MSAPSSTLGEGAPVTPREVEGDASLDAVRDDRGGARTARAVLGPVAVRFARPCYAITAGPQGLGVIVAALPISAG